MLRWVQYIFEYSPQRILNFQNIHTVHRWHHVFAAAKNITIIDGHIMVDLVVRHFLLGKIMMCLTLAMDIHNLDIHCRDIHCQDHDHRMQVQVSQLSIHPTVFRVS